MSHTVIEPVQTPERDASHGAPEELRPNSVGTGHIVFLVPAAAAPLAALVLTIPLSIGFGNGAGTPGAYAFAGIVLALFAVGYAEMSRHVVSAGGFYAYVTRGLGTMETRSPDVLSYIMFQQEFIKALLEIGEADGEAHADRMEEFMGVKR